MDYIDYRTKLGLGFCDDEKQKAFIARVKNYYEAFLDSRKTDEWMYEDTDAVLESEFQKYCDIVGIEYGFKYEYVLTRINRSLAEAKENFKEFLYRFITLINCINDREKGIKKRELLSILDRAFNESQILYVVLKDENNYFVFPKGSKELDEKLISEPLEWLNSYPNTYPLYVKTLKDYADDEKPRDIADNLRKTLEMFLQEFFNNQKNLDKNISEVGKYLDEKNVDKDLKALFTTLLSNYNQANNSIAKHHDRIHKKMLEFVLYQTGTFIRTLIQLKKDNQSFIKD